ncbi:MAG: SRPBCC family protein [Planctomycetota bacterium]
MPRTRRLEQEQVLPCSLDDVFAFFADARNLEALTPPWLQFQILTEGEIPMQEGALIDYRIKLHGVPLRWRTRISAWEPPGFFVDEQIKGPYTLWRHAHTFEALDAETTRVLDRVDYAHWGGPLIERWFVRPDLERIFAYRAEALARRFGAREPAAR